MAQGLFAPDESKMVKVELWLHGPPVVSAEIGGMELIYSIPTRFKPDLGLKFYKTLGQDHDGSSAASPRREGGQRRHEKLLDALVSLLCISNDARQVGAELQLDENLPASHTSQICSPS